MQAVYISLDIPCLPSQGFIKSCHVTMRVLILFKTSDLFEVHVNKCVTGRGTSLGCQTFGSMKIEVVVYIWSQWDEVCCMNFDDFAVP
jgi:hypothetical protein